MSITLESLSAQLNNLNQQYVATSNIAQQHLGAIGVIQKQINDLTLEAELKLKESQDGQANKQGEGEAA